MQISELYKIFRQYPKITTDSRNVEKNSIFFALRGEKFDGNRFAKEALQKGARYAVIDNKDFFIDENKTILVENSLKTLQQLANFHRKQLKIKIFALTGTNGKTTTKELIYRVLDKKFKTYATEGNLNNHIGVPLNLLRITEDYQFAVIEMGASKPLDIKELCDIADPDYGLITNIGTAHIQGFGSAEGLINTKKELYDHLMQKNATIFINIDNPILKKIIGDYKHIFTYGTENGLVKGSIKNLNPFLVVEYQADGKKFEINTNLIGKYNLENVLAAVAVGKFFEIPDNQIIEAIESYKPTNNRSQLDKTNKNTLIRDLYNANPTSMRLALENFAELKADKKAVILGDMLELGNISDQAHREIIQLLEKLNFDKVFLVGKNFKKNNFNPNFLTFENTDELNKYLEINKLEGFFILLKGSRGIHLEDVLKNL